jgi:hypothetical protein
MEMNTIKNELGCRPSNDEYKLALILAGDTLGLIE